MKTALIAAGVLAASTLLGLPDASAKGQNFGLTIGGPNGFIQINGQGKNHGSKYGKKVHGNGNKSYGYGNKGYGNGNMGYGYGNKGYGYGNKGYGYGKKGYTPYRNRYGYGSGYGYNLQRDRARGYCMYPNEIRQMLRYQGWHGFRVKKLTPSIAIIHTNRNGMRYRLKLNRCTGEMIRVKPLGGYGGYGYY